MIENKNGYLVNKEDLPGGLVRVTLEFNPEESVPGNKCVSRTVISGNLATFTRAVIATDENGEMSIVKSDDTTTVKSSTVDGAKAELEKALGGTIVVHEVRKVEQGVFGIPKEIFSMIARPATRPDSQINSKATVGGDY